MHIKKERWGAFKSREVYLYTLTNSLGGVVQLTNYGARVVAIQVDDKNGAIGDVALGFDSLTPYLEDENYIGATMGRFANRISNARFDLDGVTWRLEANEGRHCNHSASAGFDHRVFEVDENREQTGASGELTFHLSDAHGTGGFPGNLQLMVIYVWEEEANRLTITYRATTDRSGILNLTNHCYFNLSGQDTPGHPFQDCLSHHLEVFATKQLEMDKQHLPTGHRLPVEESIVSGLIRDQCNLVVENGANEYDHPDFRGLNSCYELIPKPGESICRLQSAVSGRQLDISTSYPGLMVYTGDDLHSYEPGYFGRPYRSYDGVALECQYYPDSPNLPEFPPAAIHPDKPYQEYISYTFTSYHP